MVLEQPATGVRIRAPDGLGPEVRRPFDPFGLLRRDGERIAMQDCRWISPIAYFVGPVDGTGLDDAKRFWEGTSVYGKPPQVRLVVARRGLGIAPMRQVGLPETLWIPYADIADLTARPGAQARAIMVTPGTAARKLGSVICRTRANREARLNGVPTRPLVEALRTLGAALG